MSLEAPVLSGGIQLAATNFNAEANFGFIGVAIADGSIVDLETGPSGLEAAVRFVDSDGQIVERVNLSELFDALTGNTATGPLGDVTVEVDLTGRVKFDLPITVNAGIGDISADQGTLVVTVPDITTTLADSNQPAVVDVDLADFGQQLANLKSLSFHDVIDGLREVITFMESVEDQPELSQQLPLVDFQSERVLLRSVRPSAASWIRSRQ